MGGAGLGPVPQGVAAASLQHLQAHPRQAHAAHHKEAVAGHAAAARQKTAGLGGFAPDRHADVQLLATGEIPPGQGHALLSGQGGHAAEKGFQPGHVHPVRQAQAEGETQRPGPAGGQIADVDGQSLVPRVLGAEIGAPEVDVLQKEVAAHAQGPPGLEHRTVVAPAQQQGGMRLGKMAGEAGQNAVLGKGGSGRGWRGRNHVSSP